MKIVYYKDTNEILQLVPQGIDIDTFYFHYSQEFKDSIDYISILLEDIPKDLRPLNIRPSRLWTYLVIDNTLIKRPGIELEEADIYGKILTEEERVDVLLTPTQEEIQKAKNTIEILSLLQEVM